MTWFDMAADYLARCGYAVVSAEIAAPDSIERDWRSVLAVPSQEFEAVVYAIYAGPYGDHHRAHMFA